MAKATKGVSAPDFGLNYAKRQRHTLLEQQLLAVYTVLLQVEPLTKEQPVTVRTSLAIKG